VWEARPELRHVYREWFTRLLGAVEGLDPVVEVGAGPGFLKEFAPHLIATDVVAGLRVDVRCDADVLPFRSASVGGLVLVDTLHHLPRPLDFLAEAARVLQPRGRVAMIEPWITPPSWVLYRYFHHEDCRLGVDLTRPFDGDDKAALDGNAAIPYLTLARVREGRLPLRLLSAEPFIGLPYLVTFGFKVERPLPQAFQRLARLGEAILDPLRRWLATRTLVVLEKPA
jgi:SAM-dependent methyltransferase